MRMAAHSQDRGDSCKIMGTERTRARGGVGEGVLVGVDVAVGVGVEVSVGIGVRVSVGTAEGVSVCVRLGASTGNPN